MKEIKGICKKAIEKEWCLGCNKLEDKNFVGVNYCKNIDEGVEYTQKKKSRSDINELQRKNNKKL